MSGRTAQQRNDRVFVKILLAVGILFALAVSGIRNSCEPPPPNAAPVTSK